MGGSPSADSIKVAQAASPVLLACELTRMPVKQPLSMGALSSALAQSELEASTHPYLYIQKSNFFMAASTTRENERSNCFLFSAAIYVQKQGPARPPITSFSNAYHLIPRATHNRGARWQRTRECIDTPRHQEFLFGAANDATAFLSCIGKEGDSPVEIAATAAAAA